MFRISKLYTKIPNNTYTIKKRLITTNTITPEIIINNVPLIFVMPLLYLYKNSEDSEDTPTKKKWTFNIHYDDCNCKDVYHCSCNIPNFNTFD